MNYVIYFKKVNGTNKAKVFRLSSKTVNSGDTIECEKTHKLLPFINQSFYPGRHWVEIQVNGRVSEKRSFTMDIMQ